MKVVSQVLASDGTDVSAQLSVAETNGENYDKCSNYMREPPPRSFATKGVRDEGENRDITISSETFHTTKINELSDEERDIMPEISGVTGTETLDYIQIKVTGEEVIDIFIASREPLDDVVFEHPSGEERELIPNQGEGSGVPGMEILSNIQVEVTGEEVIDIFIANRETSDNVQSDLPSDEERKLIPNRGRVSGFRSREIQSNIQVKVLPSQGEGTGVPGSEMLRNIQVEVTGEEVIDAFIKNSETLDNVEFEDPSGDEREMRPNQRGDGGVTGIETLGSTQIKVTGEEELDLFITTSETLDDARLKGPCNKERGTKLNTGRRSRLSGRPQRSIALIVDTTVLNNPIAVIDEAKDSNENHNQSNVKDNEIENTANVTKPGNKERETKLNTSRPSHLSRRTRRSIALIADTTAPNNPIGSSAVIDQAKDSNENHSQSNGKDNEIENTANVTNKLNESKSGSDLCSILKKSKVKERKEIEVNFNDEKSVYSTFSTFSTFSAFSGFSNLTLYSTDTYDSFQSLVQGIEKEALLCFIKLGRYFGL